MLSDEKKQKLIKKVNELNNITKEDVAILYKMQMKDTLNNPNYEENEFFINLLVAKVQNIK